MKCINSDSKPLVFLYIDQSIPHVSRQLIVSRRDLCWNMGDIEDHSYLDRFETELWHELEGQKQSLFGDLERNFHYLLRETEKNLI